MSVTSKFTMVATEKQLFCGLIEILHIYITSEIGSHSALAGKFVQNNSRISCRVRHRAANKRRDGTGEITDWCIPLRGCNRLCLLWLSSMALLGWQRYFTTRLWGTAHLSLRPRSGHHIWDMEAQLWGVSLGPWPHREQASFTSINKGDVGCVLVDQKVLVAIWTEWIWNDERGAADGVNWSDLKTCQSGK